MPGAWRRPLAEASEDGPSNQDHHAATIFTCCLTVGALVAKSRFPRTGVAHKAGYAPRKQALAGLDVTAHRLRPYGDRGRGVFALPARARRRLVGQDFLP